MIFRRMQSRFRFDKKERSGIFFLSAFVLLLQPLVFGWENAFATLAPEGVKSSTAETAYHELYSSKYTYNPNFLTDYRGYVLGMTTEEIDRLHRFREKGRYVIDASQFLQLTGMDAEKFRHIEPQLRFPDPTVVKKRKQPVALNEKRYVKKSDLNTADEAEFDRVYGIGKTLSHRIVKYRKLLGGFSLDEQLFEVYGLDSSTVRRVLERFEVKTIPSISKLDINKVSVKELQSLPYLNRDESMKIVAYRTAKGNIKTVDELRKIEGFPAVKIDRIKLYLAVEP
ncbi:ComEA family DNA-binding protein [Sinomicrobium sp.]